MSMGPVPGRARRVRSDIAAGPEEEIATPPKIKDAGWDTTHARYNGSNAQESTITETLRGPKTTLRESKTTLRGPKTTLRGQKPL